MRIFRCSCADKPLLFFENISCSKCERMTGFDAESLDMKTFEQANPGTKDRPVWECGDGRYYLQCDNWTTHNACNWMVQLEQTNLQDALLQINSTQLHLCRSCNLNSMVPDLNVVENITLWGKLESAKRRCLYTLLSLELPFDRQSQLASSVTPNLAFKFLAAASDSNQDSIKDSEPVITGHKNGVITIDLAEADDVERTRMQLSMNEDYRTLLGHFRHETGHYYWDVFQSKLSGFSQRFRSLFGDERENYLNALNRHHSTGPKPQWREQYISSYATAHPWEDWAESWAHYLHVIDTLQTRYEYDESKLGDQAGKAVSASSADARVFSLPLPDNKDMLPGRDFSTIMGHWNNTAVLLNSLNRSMGLPDPYPFVTSEVVYNKLLFIDNTLQELKEINPTT